MDGQSEANNRQGDSGQRCCLAVVEDQDTSLAVSGERFFKRVSVEGEIAASDDEPSATSPLLGRRLGKGLGEEGGGETIRFTTTRKISLGDDARKKTEDMIILAVTLAVLFSLYSIATFLSAFFPYYAETHGISGSFSGLIFSAYPLGIAITSITATDTMQRLGLKRCVVVGVSSVAVLIFLFGATPTIAKFFALPQYVEKWVFLTTYFLAGLFGSVAETGSIVMANYRFRANPGAISAVICTTCGIGCMAGPPIGGILYEYGEASGVGAFLFPFIVFSALPFFILLIVLCFDLPNPHMTDQADRGEQPPSSGEAEAEEKAKDSSQAFRGKGTDSEEGHSTASRETGVVSVSLYEILNRSRLITIASLGINSALVASLDPTLECRLEEEKVDVSIVGIAFMVSSVSYIITSMPLGCLLDSYSKDEEMDEEKDEDDSVSHKHNNNNNNNNQRKGCMFKIVQGLGLLALALCFSMLGPIQIRGVGEVFDNTTAIWVAMVLKGFGSTGCTAGYPDLIVGVSSTSKTVHARLSGLWNATYAIGWAIGPLLGGCGFQILGFSGYATSAAAIAFCAMAVLFSAACMASISTCASNGPNTKATLASNGPNTKSIKCILQGVDRRELSRPFMSQSKLCKNPHLGHTGVPSTSSKSHTTSKMPRLRERRD